MIIEDCDRSPTYSWHERNDYDLKRGCYRVHGDVLEIIPINDHSKGIRIEFWGDEVDSIRNFRAFSTAGGVLSFP